jgi:hypothetical protein
MREKPASVAVQTPKWDVARHYQSYVCLDNSQLDVLVSDRQQKLLLL